MIINRYIYKEALRTLVAVTLVLVLVFISSQFVRFLGDVAQGEIPADYIFGLLVLSTIIYLVNVVPLSFYLSILLTFGRLYHDSEMIAMNACGIGPGDFMKIILKIVPIVVAIVAVLSLYVTPWAAEKSAQIYDEIARSTEITGLAAGQFRESSDGNFIFYVEGLSDDGKVMENVFVQSRRFGKLWVLSSESGYRYVDEVTGDNFIVMIDGYRYEGRPGTPGYKITKFGKFAVRIEEKDTAPARRNRRSLPTTTLWDSGDPAYTASLQWRISMPLSVIFLAMIALPLSRSLPREGRFAKVFVAILVYIVYSNMMSVARDLVSKQNITPFIGMWWVHLLMLIAVIALLINQTGFRWNLNRIKQRLGMA